MNQTTVEVGDRVRHKVTQIQGEIVQMEQSLAMPHVWVIEASEREFNPPKLYRLIDLEKVEDSGSGAQKNNQSAQADGSTSKEFQAESVLTLENDATTVSTKLESQDLTVEHETVTVSTELESFVLTVESQDLTVENETVTVRSKDHFSVLTVASLDLTVSHSATTVSTEPESFVLTVENETITVSTEPKSFVLTVENDTTEGVSDSKTQRSNKRRKGKGTGRIQLRTITKPNGKQYQQFWYDWQVHTPEKTIYKSVYIPKRLVKKIQAMESTKAPVSEILAVLGVVRK